MLSHVTIHQRSRPALLAAQRLQSVVASARCYAIKPDKSLCEYLFMHQRPTNKGSKDLCSKTVIHAVDNQ